MTTTDRKLIQLGERYEKAQSMLCSFNDVFYAYEISAATEAMRLFREENAFSSVGNTGSAMDRMSALEELIDSLKPEWRERMCKRAGSEWMSNA